MKELSRNQDLENKNEYKKYKDIVRFFFQAEDGIRDKYSKNVKRIQSSNTDVDNMLNVILLSEYRRRYALEVHDVYIKPVIMFKSQRVDASNDSHEQFNDLVDTLNTESLQAFFERQ